MRLDNCEDSASDLAVGDIVFIKLRVLEPPTKTNDVKLQYLPRTGKNEYAANSVNSIFIKRPRSKLLQMLINKLC